MSKRENIVSEIIFYLNPENQQIFKYPHPIGTNAFDRFGQITINAKKFGYLNSNLLEKVNKFLDQNPPSLPPKN